MIAAYNRIKFMEENFSPSFSSVINRVIPEVGSLGAFLSFVECRRTDRLPWNDRMEEAIEARSLNKNDPWL